MTCLGDAVEQQFATMPLCSVQLDLAAAGKGSVNIGKSEKMSSVQAEATRAFLQRNYASAIVQVSAALPLALASAASSSSSSSSSEDQHTAKLLILRITALSTLYTSHAADSSARRQQTLAVLSSARKNGGDRETLELADPREMLDMDRTAFLAHLWADTLFVCSSSGSGTQRPRPQASLQPADQETLLLALAVPANVLVTLIFACLKLDDDGEQNKSNSTPSKTALSASTPSLPSNGAKVPAANGHGPQAGLFAARSLAEWFLAAYTSAGKNSSTSTTADETYRRILPLYCLQLVALRSNEWEYASETIGYSVLDETTKRQLLAELDGLHSKVVSGKERRVELAKVLEEERKVSEAKVRIAVAAASGGQQQQQSQQAGGRSAVNGKRSHTANGRAVLSASTPALSSPQPLSPPTTSSPSPRLPAPEKDDEDEGHLTTDLIRAANDKVRSQRDFDSSSPSSPLPVQQQQDQQDTRRGVSTMLSTYLSPRTWSFSRYISLILFVLAIAYPRWARARSSSSITSAGQLTQGQGSVVGGLARRLWDTVRMGTQVTYL
ncbi:unnamed protein product [Tilletia laevis]|nr:unnamed protein product [Tilletia laevis]